MENCFERLFFRVMQSLTFGVRSCRLAPAFNIKHFRIRIIRVNIKITLLYSDTTAREVQVCRYSSFYFILFYLFLEPGHRRGPTGGESEALNATETQPIISKCYICHQRQIQQVINSVYSKKDGAAFSFFLIKLSTKEKRLFYTFTLPSV